jgi:lysophospholipase L1-like esterase
VKKFFVVLFAVVVVALAVHTTAAAVFYPNSMASTGDSITRAFNTGTYALLDAPSNSWSTGSGTSVNSMYRRFLGLNPLISGKNYNDAKTGAKMVDLNGQVTTVNSQHVDYVTILMGANDACTSSESGMTSVSTFRNQFQQAMNTLTTGSPNAEIYVLSIPNVYNLWSVLRTNLTALSVWESVDICQSMLDRAYSTSSTDEARRQRVLQRVKDFNTVLQEVCAQYTQCRFDNLAVFNTVFTKSDVSTRDYFHPSIAGQNKLAQAAWGASGK